MRAKTAKWRVFMRGLKFASCHVWCVCWLRVAPLFKGVIRECVWLNGMEPDQTSHPNSCHLAQRVSFGGHFFPLRLPRDFTFPPSCEVFGFFFLEGGIWSGCCACVCAHTWVCCVCVSPPHSTMHFVPLASFAGELCVTLVFRQHRRGHAIYAPLPPSSASRCTLLPPFFLSPSLPSLLFVGCSTALTRSTGNK